MSNYNKITALYSRLSVGDEDRDGGESNSIQNQKIFLENYLNHFLSFLCHICLRNSFRLLKADLEVWLFSIIIPCLYKQSNFNTLHIVVAIFRNSKCVIR